MMPLLRCMQTANKSLEVHETITNRIPPWLTNPPIYTSAAGLRSRQPPPPRPCGLHENIQTDRNKHTDTHTYSLWQHDPPQANLCVIVSELILILIGVYPTVGIGKNQNKNFFLLASDSFCRCFYCFCARFAVSQPRKVELVCGRLLVLLCSSMSLLWFYATEYDKDDDHHHHHHTAAITTHNWWSEGFVVLFPFNTNHPFPNPGKCICSVGTLSQQKRRWITFSFWPDFDHQFVCYCFCLCPESSSGRKKKADSQCQKRTTNLKKSFSLCLWL